MRPHKVLVLSTASAEFVPRRKRVEAVKEMSTVMTGAQGHYPVERSCGCNCAPAPEEPGMAKPRKVCRAGGEVQGHGPKAKVKVQTRNRFEALMGEEHGGDDEGEADADTSPNGCPNTTSRRGIRHATLGRVETKVELGEEVEEWEINEVSKKDGDEITVDSGAARNVWPKERKEGGKIKPAEKAGKLVAANGTDIPITGEKVVKFMNDGRRCAMNFLVTTVRKPLAAVSSIVDEGNVVVFGPGKD